MDTAQLSRPSPAKGLSGASAWRAIAQQIVQAAATSAIHLQSDDASALQRKLLQGLELLKSETSEEAIRQRGEEIANQLDRYNRATQEAVIRLMDELRDAVFALSEGMRAVTAPSAIAASLESIESLLAGAESEAGRARIAEVIGQARRNEAARLAQCQELAEAIHGRVDKLESAIQQPPPCLFEETAPAAPVRLQVDPLTGISDGMAAREAILRAHSKDKPPYLAVIHIQALEALNARFGQRIGDQIVLACCEHLLSNLCRGDDRLFRWRGPAFVALLERDESPAAVSRDLSQVCNSIPSTFFGEPHRSILIPLKLAATTLPLGSRLISEVFDSIERFIVRAGRPSS